MNPNIHTAKFTLVRRSVLLAAASLAAVLAGCSKEERTQVADQAKDAYQDTKAAVAKGWDNLKSYTFEQRDAFTLEVKAKQAEFEANLSKLRAEYSEAQASASRKAAMEELKNSEADYKAKLDALGTATADTWNAARDDVMAAWDRLQAAYAKARAD